MDKEIKRLIEAKKIHIRLGRLYYTTDQLGNIVWHIEQKPMIKE